MSESIESMQRPPLEVVELPTDRLEPDAMNPNRVEPSRMAALRKDIAEHGFVQPCVVRPLGRDRWRLVDGEHRWRTLKDLGVKTTPCVIDDAPEDDARMRGLTLNGLRGKPHPVKLAQLLAGLAERMDETELRERLGMQEEEFTAAIELKDAGLDIDAKLKAALEREEADAPEVLRWKFGPRQAVTIEKALDALTAEGHSRADALVIILDTERPA